MAAAPFVLASGTGNVQAFTGSCKLLGWSLRESAGTAAVATVFIRDGTTTSGDIRAVIELNGDQSTTMWFGPEGVMCAAGIFVHRSAGSTEGVVYFG